MTLSEIFNTCPAGSSGFVRAVSTHCGYDLSDEDCASIGRAAWEANPDNAEAAAAEFQRMWQDGFMG